LARNIAHGLARNTRLERGTDVAFRGPKIKKKVPLLFLTIEGGFVWNLAGLSVFEATFTLSTRNQDSEQQMPFKVTGTGAEGAEAKSVANAKQALDCVLEFERRGFQKIVAKDNLKRTISRDQLIMLVHPDG
jgi:hypothetical protein